MTVLVMIVNVGILAYGILVSLNNSAADLLNQALKNLLLRQVFFLQSS